MGDLPTHDSPTGRPGQLTVTAGEARWICTHAAGGARRSGPSDRSRGGPVSTNRTGARDNEDVREDGARSSIGDGEDNQPVANTRTRTRDRCVSRADFPVPADSRERKSRWVAAHCLAVGRSLSHRGVCQCRSDRSGFGSLPRPVSSDLHLQREAQEGANQNDRAQHRHTDEVRLRGNSANDVTGNEELQSQEDRSPEHLTKLAVNVLFMSSESQDSSGGCDRSPDHDHCNSYAVDGGPDILDDLAVAHLAPSVGPARFFVAR
jgi:hypothetical protein